MYGKVITFLTSMLIYLGFFYENVSVFSAYSFSVLECWNILFFIQMLGTGEYSICEIWLNSLFISCTYKFIYVFYIMLYFNEKFKNKNG